MLDFQQRNQNKQTKFNYFRILENSDNIIKLTSDKKCVSLKDQPNITFHGEYIFCEDSQNVVCDTILNGVVEAGLEGISCLMLAYGAGGSGKTLTCFGSHGCWDNRGVSYRLLEQIFEARQKMEDNYKIVIELGFLEFTLTNTIDLLQYKKYGHSKHSYFTSIETISEGKSLLYFGEKMRQSLKLEKQKSHKYSAILAIRLTCKCLTKSNSIITKATIQIADLAALELSCHKNISMDYNYNKNTKDSFVGNITMMQISHLLHKRRKNETCIFRSPIVRYLNATLSPCAITKFVGHSSGSMTGLDTLKSVIRVANQFAMQKFNEVQNNTEVDRNLYIEKLQTEIKRLRTEMALRVMTQGETICPKENKSQKQIQKIIEDFLKNGDMDVDVHFTQNTECFKILKETINKLKFENNKLQLELAAIQGKDDITNTPTLSTNDDLSIKSAHDKKKTNGVNLSKQSQNSFRIPSSIEQVGELALGRISIGPAQTQTILNKRVDVKIEKYKKQEAAIFYRRSAKKSKELADEVTENVMTLMSGESLNNTINKMQKDYLSICTLLRQAHSHVNTLKNHIGGGVSYNEIELGTTVITKHLYVIHELEEKVSKLKQAILDIQERLDQGLESNNQKASWDNTIPNPEPPVSREDH